MTTNTDKLVSDEVVEAAVNAASHASNLPVSPVGMRAAIQAIIPLLGAGEAAGYFDLSEFSDLKKHGDDIVQHITVCSSPNEFNDTPLFTHPALSTEDGRDALVDWLRSNGKRCTEQRGDSGRYPSGECWGHAYGVEVVKFDAKDFDAAIKEQRG